MTLFWIGTLGLLGVYTRYFTGVIFSRYLGPSFPWATLTINLAGAFAIGVIVALEQNRFSPELRIGILVGFLGGFTTFSSYCLEAVHLAKDGDILRCFLYLAGSPVLGFIATALGMLLTRRAQF